MEPLVCHPSKGQSRFGVFWFLLFLLWFQYSFWHGLGAGTRDDLVVGGVGSLVFGGLFFLSIRWAFQSGGVLVIDDAGAHYPSSGVEVFRWEDIRSVEYRPWRLHVWVDLHLVNEAEYVSKLRGIPRWSSRFSRFSGGPKFSILITALDVPEGVIWKAIQERVTACQVVDAGTTG